MIVNERKFHADFADSADKILDNYKKNLPDLPNLRENNIFLHECKHT